VEQRQKEGRFFPCVNIYVEFERTEEFKSYL